MAELLKGVFRIFLLLALVLEPPAEAARKERNEVVTCPRNYKCVAITQCDFGPAGTDFIYPCHNGLNRICCPPRNVKNVTTNTIVERSEDFPSECGVIKNDDKISGGQNAAIGQFPWMALLGYKQKQLDFVVFQCGGSIITNFYILTAAHCLFIDDGLQLKIVRIGELNLQTNIDCENQFDTLVCAEPHIDIEVEKAFPHKNYNGSNLKNDIALVRVKRKILFTDFIQPVCLPFERNFERRSFTNEKFIVSGWGKTHFSNLGGSTQLQFTTVTVWNQTKCAYAIPPDVKPLDDRQLCANGKRNEDACKGDSGGPLINATIERGQLRNFQVGIVSFASTQTCGNPELPTVYTRVDRYLQWIVDNVQ